MIKNAILLCVIILTACSYKPTLSNNESPEKVLTEQVHILDIPELPAMVDSENGAINFLSVHYWDNMQWKDHSWLQDTTTIERYFAQFIAMLNELPANKAEIGIKQMMKGAACDSTMFAGFYALGEKFLYDPNSPFRNEELFIPILRIYLAMPSIAPIYKSRPRFLLNMALKNRKGESANDFTLTLANGENKRLSSIKADYILLFFNNPDCHDCSRVKTHIETSAQFSQLQQEGKLQVVAVYPDTNLEAWRNTDYPKQWINGYDKEESIQTNQLYDLKAIPTLYLLDKNRRVLLKDAPIEQIEMWNFPS